MEYVPPVNCTVLTAPASVMSSMAAEMLPPPSATKLPTRAINAPGLRLASLPLIEKAYVPFRLAFEKAPVGGGGVGVEEPPPPQAAANTASAPTAHRIARRFTVHLPAYSWWLQIGLAAAGNPQRCAAPASECPFESPGPETASRSRKARSRQ